MTDNKSILSKREDSVVISPQFEVFFSDVRRIIEEARNNAVRSVDFCRVQMYWNIGRRIFEEEQQGKDRAEYGTYLIKNLSKDLEPEYGSGFSKRQHTCFVIYLVFADRRATEKGSGGSEEFDC